MKKILSVIALIVGLTTGAMAQYNSTIHYVQGGSELVAEAGSTITIKSGAVLTADAGSVLNFSTAASTNYLTLSGALTVGGASYLGAAGTKSTVTAAGIATFNGALTAATVTSVAGVSGTTLSMSGAGDIAGQFTFGAAGTKSTGTTTGTLTVPGALNAGTSVGAATTVTAGTNLIATAGYHQLYSRTFAQLSAITPTAVGQEYFCNNCVPAKRVTSTGTVMGEFSDAVGAQFK